MPPEETLSRISNKEKFAETLFLSRRARERVIRIYESRCLEIPPEADVALVLGTSLKLYPDKFKKRVFTAVSLVNDGRVPMVIFSGKQDHETDDVDQALDAKRLATVDYKLAEEKVLTVGGNNTLENLELASKLLSGYPKIISDIYLVSSGSHLIRAITLADRIFGSVGIRAHPFPIFGENRVDPNDPLIIGEVIKSILYNRTLNKNNGPIDNHIKNEIDRITNFYTRETRAMPHVPETTFEEWRNSLNK